MDWIITVFTSATVASITGIVTFAVTKFKYDAILKKDRRTRLNSVLEKIKCQDDKQNEQEATMSDLEYFINRFAICDTQYDIAKPLISDKYCCGLEEMRDIARSIIPVEGCCVSDHHYKFIDVHEKFEKTLITSIQNQLKELYA
ncbi:MAG: hypothetical protein FWD38_11700 [Oscillospiraceae bacterium]|nr:hypothetical protein [Oscillospiraceae bacterium]